MALLSFCLIIFQTNHLIAQKKNKKSKGAPAMDLKYIQQFHEAVRLKTSHQYQEAIVQFEKCAEINPNDDAVFYALSGLYAYKKEDQKSLLNLEKAAELDPQNTWYIQELAYAYFEQSKFNESKKQFEKLLKKEARNPDFLYAYAECLVRLGKTEDAIEALDKTEDQVGVFPDLSIQKSKLYQSIKNNKKAEEELLNALSKYPKEPQILAVLTDFYFQIDEVEKAIKMLEALAKADPNNGRAHLALGDIYRQQNKFKEAFVEFKMAFASDEVDKDSKIKIVIQLFETSHLQDPAMIELLDILNQKYSNDPKLKTLEGDYYNNNNNLNKALLAYKEALKYDKSKFAIWNQVLLLEYELYHYEDLKIDSKAAIEYFPTQVTCYLMFGVSYNKLGSYQEANDVLMAGLDLANSDKGILSELHVQLGIAKLGIKKGDEAQKHFDEALNLTNFSPYVKNELAFQLANFKIDFNTAEVLIDDLIKNNPDDALYIGTKGFILMQQKKYADAEKYFLKSLSINSLQPFIHMYLGDLYNLTGKPTEAKRYWKEAQIQGLQFNSLDEKINK